MTCCRVWPGARRGRCCTSAQKVRNQSLLLVFRVSYSSSTSQLLNIVSTEDETSLVIHPFALYQQHALKTGYERMISSSPCALFFGNYFVMDESVEIDSDGEFKYLDLFNFLDSAFV